MAPGSYGLAERLAGWAARLVPRPSDLALARRSLTDTLAVTIAARDDDLRTVVAASPDTPRCTVARTAARAIKDAWPTST